jgi:hypothetical protein
MTRLIIINTTKVISVNQVNCFQNKKEKNYWVMHASFLQAHMPSKQLGYF